MKKRDSLLAVKRMLVDTAFTSTQLIPELQNLPENKTLYNLTAQWTFSWWDVVAALPASVVQAYTQ